MRSILATLSIRGTFLAAVAVTMHLCGVNNAAADEIDNICQRYAGHASSVVTLAQQENCGFDFAGRWTPNKDEHLDWCLGQLRGAGTDPNKFGAARELAKSEDMARIDGLQQCRNKAASAKAAEELKKQREEEMRVTGKTAEQCAASNASCEARVKSTFPLLNQQIALVEQCVPFFVQCSNNAAMAAAAAANPPPPAEPAPAPGGGLTASTCGLSGTATVTIADPALTTLNVRDKPNGQTILTTLPRNSQVNVVGACGVKIAAGIVAQKPTEVVPGWCAISAPVTGCVKEEFLTAGMPMQGGLPAGAAGIVANKPVQQQQPAPQPQMQTPPVVAAPPVVMTAPMPAGSGQMAQLTQGANVRNEPSGNAKDKNGNNNVLGSLPGGTTLTVLDCNNSWCRIAHPQYPSGGWVSRKFVQMTGVAVTVQVTTPPPVIVMAPEPAPAPAMPQGDAGGLTASTCGLSGTATIKIADPKLTTLNVRDRPNGPTILTTLPVNSQVNVVGACGKKIAAGIVAGPVGTVVPGWCAISAPVTGCVKEEFLVAGIPAAAPAGAAPGTAGLVAAKPTFTGTWAAEAQGSNYTFTLNQSGGAVTGNYTGSDGSSGQLSGNVSDNVLRFTWQQTDGLKGAGKFTMSDDGGAFDGSYTLGSNPDVADGSWNGRRQ